jgi:hypothetical protein
VTGSGSEYPMLVICVYRLRQCWLVEVGGSGVSGCWHVVCDEAGGEVAKRWVVHDKIVENLL